MVGVVGGFSSALLFLAFAYTSSFRLLLYLLVLIVGILVGLEIPLLMRLLHVQLQHVAARRTEPGLRRHLGQINVDQPSPSPEVSAVLSVSTTRTS